MQIITCAQMKEMERQAIASGISAIRLMENAGCAATRCIRETVPVSGKRCLVLCGRGNNAGDGFVVARRLMEAGAQVAVIMACGAPAAPEAAEMYERLTALRPIVIDVAELERQSGTIRSSDLIVDAVFGTGFHGEIEDARLATLFEAVNGSGATIFSLDMPSGTNADTGEAATGCIRAQVTVTFGAPKAGQYLYPAARYCGRIHAVDIGISEFAKEPDGGGIALLEGADIAHMLPVRAQDSNKGSYGKVLCICGSLGMAGAAYLSTSGAMRSGAGLVTLCVPQPIYLPVAAKLNECLVYPLDATVNGTFSYSCLGRIEGLAKSASVVLIGCGLSRDEETQHLVHALVSGKNLADKVIILDADGINAFAGHIDLLRTSGAEIVLTPHPGEMSRLCGKTIPDIQEHRLETAKSFAMENGVTLVLKGANTVIASSDGSLFINPTGNPGMAKGGSGDILAGMIAGLRAQGLACAHAACCGAFIHGAAGDRAAEKLSQYGMLPTDLLMEVPQIFREMSR